MATESSSDRPSVAALGAEGPYRVGELELPFRTGGTGFTLAKIGYPALEGGPLAHADKSGAPYPAVVLAPATWSETGTKTGTKTAASRLDWLSRHLVQHGYVVFRYAPEGALGTDPDLHADTITDAFDRLVDADQERFTPLRGLVDTSAFAAVGVSAGAAGALAAAARDKRIRAVVGIAPGRNPKEADTYALVDSAVAAVRVPALILAGQHDKVSSGAALHYWDLIPQGYKVYLEISGGNHAQFLGPGDADVRRPGQPRDGKPGIPAARQHALANLYATAFLNAALKGHADYEAYLHGESGRAALDEGVLSDMRHVPGPLPMPPPASGGVFAAAAAAPVGAALGNAVQAGASLLATLDHRVSVLVRAAGAGLDRRLAALRGPRPGPNTLTDPPKPAGPPPLP
ncbi:poly(ethylene terephthalate) hydrolase family protein [Yinghuangia soli]|uniref:PET hydrolase/cutinase-like domain-containing protein n=1 Tax=Yinghuangia soli TaxID=2908204 RepID=A0AA41PWY1_9ACTN|nr:hypothetical protein [Yinghuangia soli]MCF2527359.1 hypothetical protein [Yinghuangia soli]